VFARDAGHHWRAAMPRHELALQLDQHGLGEAGADAAGEGQPAIGVVYGQGERADRPGSAAAAGFVAMMITSWVWLIGVLIQSGDRRPGR
jgi:ferric-dicitrate binding protein FerR (iron transport regulator)